MQALTREIRLQSALVVARNAMDERRGYASEWEWKYGKEWDEEDAIVGAALVVDPLDRGERPLFVEGV